MYLKSFLGSGIMGIAYGFLMGGVVLGTGMIVFVAILSAFCCGLLVKVKRAVAENEEYSNANPSFVELGEILYGRFGEC